MAAPKGRPLVVFALFFLVLGLAAFLIFSRDRSCEALLSEFRARFASSPDAAVDFLVERIKSDPPALLWFKKRFDRPNLTGDEDCAAAHAVVLAAGGEFSVPLKVLLAALRYRYRAGKPLNALSKWSGMRDVFDFMKPAAFADARDKEALFWISFFHVGAMRLYYETFGWDDFQRLLQAMLFYPYSRRANSAFDSSPCRRAAVELISLPALRALVAGSFSLPFGLDKGLDRSFEPPAELENVLGWKPALDWYLAGMKAHPEAKERFLLKVAALDSDEARGIVERALEEDPPGKDYLHLFFEPCYENGVRMPPALIRKGLDSADERVRIKAMMNALNLSGAERLNMVREILARDDLHVKYLLVHRLEGEDIDDASWRLLKKMFEGDLDMDWGISRLEAFEIAAKIYRIYGNAGLLDLFRKSLFEAHAAKLADVLELLTGKADIREHRSLASELKSVLGSPVWWLVAGAELGKTAAPDLAGRSLGVFLRDFDPDAEGTPPPWWRALYAADALDPSPRRLKDTLLPLRMFGFLPLDDPWEMLRRAFRRGDEHTVGLALEDEGVRRRFFESFLE